MRCQSDFFVKIEMFHFQLQSECSFLFKNLKNNFCKKILFFEFDALLRLICFLKIVVFIVYFVYYYCMFLEDTIWQTNRIENYQKINNNTVSITLIKTYFLQ